MRYGHAVPEVFRKDMRTKNDHPYRDGRKAPSGARCPRCGLVYIRGKWSWKAKIKSGHEFPRLCPACRQARDRYFGGLLHISGDFVREHRLDVLSRVRHVAEQAFRERPLERIMRVDEEEGEIRIYATEEHLVARIGRALRSDFAGELEIRFGDEDKYAEVWWHRD